MVIEQLEGTWTAENSHWGLLPLQLISTSGQHRRAATSSQSPNHDRKAELHCRGTVIVEQSSCCSAETRDDCTLSTENWRPICSTSDVPVNRRNIHHRPALLWHFRDSGAGYKTADLLTYLLIKAFYTTGDNQVGFPDNCWRLAMIDKIPMWPLAKSTANPYRHWLLCICIVSSLKNMNTRYRPLC